MIYLKCCEFYDLAVAEYVKSYSLVKRAQLFENYDYADLPSGPGRSVYMEMNDGKVKSVDEWKQKRRKRRKKLIKELLEQKHK